MSTDIDLSHACNLPPREAIQYFESKGHKISFRWQDTWREAHARAFTVAGVTKADLLADIKAATAKALAEGQSKAQFRHGLEDTLKRKGWWGKGDIVNPDTGEVRKGERGSASRLNLIYRQNMQSAYNAGRYKQQMESAAVAPYWRYQSANDARTRESHRAMHGMVYRSDDPIWQTMYPPNGWGCRCRVDALTEWGLQRRKLSVNSSDGLEVERPVPIRNPDTGQIEQRTVKGYRIGGPDGPAFLPDAGFDYNPGQTFVADVKANMPEPPQRAATSWRDMGLSSLRDVPAAQRQATPPILPMAPSRAAAEAQLAKALGFAGDERLRTVTTPMGQRTIRRENLAHMVAKQVDARERYANYILPTLEQPHEIWLKEHADGKLRENYIGLFREGKNALLAVVRINRDGSLFWNMMQRTPKDMDRLREGWLVYNKTKS